MEVELADLLNKLEKVKKGKDNQYTALCPAHDDKQNSLGITADKDKIMVHCFAGCPTEAILQALGLTMSDLFITKSERPKQKRIVKEYNYTDETRKVLFQVCRMEPKSFAQRHKGNNGEWHWGITGVRRVLYHLHDIIKAPKVYLVEGEKDCDNLWDCGLVATTSPGGSNNWKDEYAQFLTNKKIILIPDSDDAGHAYARDIACSLMGKAELFCILLPTPAKDISDWLAAGNLPDELVGMEQDIEALLEGKQPLYELQDEAIMWQHKPLSFKAETLRKERTGLHGKLSILHNYTTLAWSTFNLERAEDRTKLAKTAFLQLSPEVKREYTEVNAKREFDLFCSGLWNFYLSHYSPELIYGDETPQPLNFLLYPYILEGGGTILFGKPGAGKSNTGLLWAQSINEGIDKFWKVKKAPVLYINLERSKFTIQRRLTAVNKLLELPAVTPLRILNARGKSLNDIAAACRKAIKQYGIIIIFLDSISRAGFGGLVEDRPVNAAIDALSALCETWVALAHSPRSDEAHLYGSVMFEAGADIVIKLASEASDNILGLGYEVTKTNDMARHKQVVWAMEFEEDIGLVNLRKAKPYEFPEIEGKARRPAIVTIKEYIFEQDKGEATASEIANVTGINRGQVSNILNHSEQFVKTRKEKGSQYFGVKEGLLTK